MISGASEFMISEDSYTDNSFYRQKSEAAAAQYAQRDFLMTNRGYTGKQITKIDTQYRTTFERWKAKNDEVLRYEEERNIADRWAPTSQEYLSALTILQERKYRRAIDDLERLVVQRLFEMSKLGMSGVGMSEFFLENECNLIIFQGTSNVKSSVNPSRPVSTRSSPL
jgi:hypothetical protein